MILANNDIGLWNFRRELLERLLSEGHRVTVSLPAGDRVATIRALGCDVDLVDIERRGINPFKDARLLVYYIRLVSRLRPDVMLGYTIKPNVYGGLACAIKGIPYIENITGLGSAVENPGLLQKLTVALYKISTRKARCLFFQNKGNEEFFRSHGITVAPHHIIPGSGVNIDRFGYEPYPDDGKTRFLFISRLLKEKGVEEYFAAAEHFRKIREDVEFHIIGPCEEAYEDKVKALSVSKTVVYHGPQLDVRPFVVKSSCLVHPSYYPEGLSNVILEASATGRPVIATRRHGCMEAVDEDVSGFLFPEKDRVALFACIDRFLGLSIDERRKMGKAARAKVEREFDRRIVVDAYLEEIGKAVIRK